MLLDGTSNFVLGEMSEDLSELNCKNFEDQLNKAMLNPSWCNG